MNAPSLSRGKNLFLPALGLLFCGMAVFVVSGCQREQIESYEIDRSDADPNAKVRTLAAMFFRPDGVWFFKVKGPVAEVQKHKREFDRFVQSARFDAAGDTPVTWDAPASWRKEEVKAGGGGMMIARHASFRMGPGKNALEVTVVKLGREASSIGDNINRWRRELGLEPIVSNDLDLVTKDAVIHGVEATLVDMSGPGADPAKGPPFAKSHPKVGGGASPIFTAPPSWKKLPAGGFLTAAYEVRAGDQTAKVSVTPLSGPARGLLENVNRWRDQLGLEEIEAGDLARVVHKIDVGGKPLSYVDISGKGQRILGVELIQGSSTWFFTMKGPAEVVDARKAEFETFVKSIRLDRQGSQP